MRRSRTVATGASPIMSMRIASPRSRTISSIAGRGIAKRWPPHADDDRRDDRRASAARGSRCRRPLPGALSRSTRPPICSIIGAHHVHADAAARNRGDVVLASTGPARRSGRACAVSRQRAQLALAATPAASHLGDQPVGIDAAPVIGDLDDDLVARLARRDDQAAGLALARRRAARPAPRCRDRSRCG